MEEDLRRYVRACVKLRQAWDNVAQSKMDVGQLGASAYASRTADLYCTLASKARANFVKQGGKWSSKEDFEVSLEPSPPDANHLVTVDIDT